MTQAPNWWKDFYGDVFADVMLEHEKNDPTFQQTADFLVQELHLSASDTVFDQCCGVGAISFGLAQRGLTCIGVDQAETYITRANATAQARQLPCTFEAADAFTYKPGKLCDAAVNWYTSFGYTQSDAHNQKMLQRVMESLKPGGYFALDYTNVAHVLAENKPCKIVRQNTPYGEVKLVREYGMDLTRGMFQQTWTFILPNGTTQVFHGGVKIYMPHRIRELLEDTGFQNIRMLGDLEGTPLAPHHSRCIFLCRKPA